MPFSCNCRSFHIIYITRPNSKVFSFVVTIYTATNLPGISSIPTASYIIRFIDLKPVRTCNLSFYRSLINPFFTFNRLHNDGMFRIPVVAHFNKITYQRISVSTNFRGSYRSKFGLRSARDVYRFTISQFNGKIHIHIQHTLYMGTAEKSIANHRIKFKSIHLHYIPCLECSIDGYPIDIYTVHLD